MDRLTEIEQRLAALERGTYVFDGNFHRHSPADIRYLLDEVKRLTAERDALREALRHYEYKNWGEHICEPSCNCQSEHPVLWDGNVHVHEPWVFADAALRQARGEQGGGE